MKIKFNQKSSWTKTAIKQIKRQKLKLKKIKKMKNINKQFFSKETTFYSGKNCHSDCT